MNAGYFGQFNQGAADNTAGSVIDSIIGPGRASGGPVDAGGLYPVVENGPELLSVGDLTYLMMGNKSGKVTPTSTTKNYAGTSTTINNISVQPTSTRRTADQIAGAIALKQRIATARNG